MKFKKLQIGLSKLLDITGDVLLDECCMRVEGDRLIYLENQKGIREYSANNIAVNTSNGLVRIGGEDMVLKTLAMGQIFITGKIRSIEITPKGSK